jgi:hypothetical protein
MKKILIIIGSLILLAAIPITIYLVRHNQELRSKAAPATSLSFSPSTVTAKIGDTFTLNIQIDTGENEVFVADLHIAYDPTKLEAQSITNGPLFPNVLTSGAIDSSGKAKIMVGASSTTNPVTGTGTAATIKFKALAATSGQISIQFISPDTYVGANQEDSTNVLIGSVPAKVTITNTSNTPTSTPTPTITISTPTPTSKTTPTPTSTTSTLTPTATPTPETTPKIIISQPSSTKELSTTTPTISGSAPANETITITIHPSGLSVTVQSDALGNWSYTPSTPLEVGPHDIVVTAPDPNGGDTLSGSKSFIIAQALSGASESGTPVSGNISTTLLFLASGAVFILIGIILPSLH